MLSQGGQLFDLQQQFGRWFAFEVTMDFFSGVVAGDIPFYQEVYGGDVQELKLQASINVTTTFAI